MRNIKTEAYQDVYFKEVTELLSENENGLPKIEDSKNMLLFKNDTIIGVGSIWLNTVHPHREYISIYIDPSERNKGLGFFLFEELTEHYPFNNLQTFIDSNDKKANNFAVKCGFSLAGQSFVYEVTKVQLKGRQSEIIRRSSSLNSLTEKQFKEVINLQLEDYKSNHQSINALSKKITVKQWEELMSKDLLKEDSYVLIENDHVLSYLFCYKANKTTIEVGYTGTRVDTIKEYQDFLYHVVIQLFEKYKVIELEIDDADKNANVLADLFTYKTNISWDTYVKDAI